MVVCADTSFLFALYGSDVHTPRALAWSRASTTPITVSELTEYELGNALRFAEFRKLLAPGEAATFWAQYEGIVRAAGFCWKSAIWPGSSPRPRGFPRSTPWPEGIGRLIFSMWQRH